MSVISQFRPVVDLAAAIQKVNFIMWFPAIYLLACISCILADAPGDQELTCLNPNLVTPEDRNFPDNWIVLLDTYDYTTLYPFVGGVGSVWMNKDFDGDYDSFTLLGGACTGSSYLLCYGGRNQNNSLFSQFINYADAREINLNGTFSFSNICSGDDCRPNFVSLGIYPVNSSLPDNEKGSPVLYQPFSDSETNSRLQQDDTISILSRTVCSIRPRGYKGFYLSVNDIGACGELRRIIIYYTVCKERQVELVKCPQMPTPPKIAPDELFDCECVPHSHNVTSLQMNMFSSNSSCSDVSVSGARCECDDGYQISSNSMSCEPCAAGTYHTMGLSSTCISCPLHSESRVEGALMCECQPNYFRSPSESVSEDCTKPPSEIRKLSIIASNSTAISLSWDSPGDDGGRTDTYYVICYYFSTCTMATCELTCQRNISSLSYTLHDLNAHTRYDIFVSAHSGVSEQDTSNADRRIVEIRGRTTGGVPNTPILKRLCTVVIWKPPTMPAGIIVGYDLRFIDSSGAFIEYSHPRTDNFRITTQEQRDSNVNVQIRARNNFNPGPWTPILPIDCSDNSGICSTQLPTVCPVPPTCPTCPTQACPTQACPTTPACPTCPTQACPTQACPTTTACATCPTQACPVCPTTFSTTEAPVPTEADTVSPTESTLPPPCVNEDNQISLNGRRYNNSDTINVRDIGVQDAALIIRTSYLDCCKKPRQVLGECHYPNGALIGVRYKKEVLYRNRGNQIVRLNYPPSDRSITTGLYRCTIPTPTGDMCTVNFYLI